MQSCLKDTEWLGKYILHGVCLRWSLFSPLSFIQYKGLPPISLLMIVRIFVLHIRNRTRDLSVYKNSQPASQPASHCCWLDHETMADICTMCYYVLQEGRGMNLVEHQIRILYLERSNCNVPVGCDCVNRNQITNVQCAKSEKNLLK